MSAIAACRECGCTDIKACMTEDGPCYWAEADLCSGCAPDLSSGRLSQPRALAAASAASEAVSEILRFAREGEGLMTTFEIDVVGMLLDAAKMAMEVEGVATGPIYEALSELLAGEVPV